MFLYDFANIGFEDFKSLHKLDHGHENVRFNVSSKLLFPFLFYSLNLLAFWVCLHVTHFIIGKVLIFERIGFKFM